MSQSRSADSESDSKENEDITLQERLTPLSPIAPRWSDVTNRGQKRSLAPDEFRQLCKKSAYGVSVAKFAD